MRIISGQYKGKRINLPKHFNARPTTDFAKESFFNIINNYFEYEEINVLDLFGGTGSISYEFASRGCREIDLVESSYRMYMFIKNVISSLNLTAINPVKSDVFRYIKYCSKTYDIIFADPPYNLEQFETLPHLIFEKKLLKDKGWFVLEHSKKQDFGLDPNYFEKRIYGGVNFSFFKFNKK